MKYLNLPQQVCARSAVGGWHHFARWQFIPCIPFSCQKNLLFSCIIRQDQEIFVLFPPNGQPWPARLVRATLVVGPDALPQFPSSARSPLLEFESISSQSKLGMPQTELAMLIGSPIETVNEIIQGKAAIATETALQIERVLHIPASFWLKLDQYYREFLVWPG
jgi:hypothetical protein